MNKLLRRYPVTGFYILAYAFTWSLGIPMMLSQRGLIALHIPHGIEPVAAFGPFIAAMLVARALSGRDGPRAILQSLRHWRVGTGWMAFSILGPVVLLVIALMAYSFIRDPQADTVADISTFTTAAGLFDLIVVAGILQSWGEEPGWRGFALPTLRERFGPFLATLVLWPVWLCWHLPFFLSRPGFGWAQWAGFSIGILSAAIWLTLIQDRTKSVLMSLGWHAMANICRNSALAVSTLAFLMYNNLILLTALIIAGYWFWSGRRQKS